MITGGASGIGKIISNAFLRNGDNVAILSQNEIKYRQFAEENSIFKHNIFHYKVDVCNYAQVSAAFSKLINKLGTIDVLINNAGILGPAGVFDEVDINYWLQNLNTNLIGAANTMHIALKSMKANNSGRVINIAGGGSVKPLPTLSAYSASKSGLVRLTETLAHEYIHYGIYINAISPGFITTGIHDEILKMPEFIDDKLLTEFRTKINSGGDNPELTADLCLFLASNESTGISGRLISSIHDDWKSFNHNNLADKALYTLRRVDNYFVTSKKAEY